MTGPASQGLSTTGYCHYSGVGGRHTRIMVYHVLRLGSRAKLNFAVFYSCWDLSGSVFTFRITDSRLMIYTFAA